MGLDGSGALDYFRYRFLNRSRPDTAERPYEASDNLVSRQGRHCSEGMRREYDQPRDLYDRVMTDEGRAYLHSNTATVLKLVENQKIQTRYLAQCYRISPKYAQGIYALLPKPEFNFGEVREMAEDAECS